MNHNKNENEIDYFQCDCIEPRIKIDEKDSKGNGFDSSANQRAGPKVGQSECENL